MVDGEGLVRAAHPVQDGAEIAMGHGQIGLKSDGTDIGFNRLVEPTPGLQGIAQVVVGHGQIGLKLDGAVVAFNRLVEMPLNPQHAAQIVVGWGIVGFELHDAPETGNRQLPLAGLAVRLTEIAVILGDERVDGNRPADPIDRSAQIARLTREDAEQMQRVGMIGVLRQDQAIHRLRISPSATLMMTDGNLHRLVDRDRRHKPVAPLMLWQRLSGEKPQAPFRYP